MKMWNTRGRYLNLKYISNENYFTKMQWKIHSEYLMVRLSKTIFIEDVADDGNN